MITKTTFWCSISILILFTGVLSGASPKFSEEAIRAAVQKSIPMLEMGSIGSADQRECFTCHSQALPVFALMEARRQGFDIDDSNLQRQLKHTYDHLHRGVDNYRQAKGQGGGVLTAGYALWTLEVGQWQGDETTTAVVHYLTEIQSDRSHWQHRGTRPPSSGSDFTATYVALRGMAAFGNTEQQTRITTRRNEAARWLINHQPSDTEDAVFRLKSFRYIDAPSEAIESATQELVRQQRDDGGWSQNDELQSDAYATGTVLETLLRQGTIKPESPEVQRGVAFLLRTQCDDGTWHVLTRAKPFQEYYESRFPHAKDQFISIAATAWAALALLAALPEPVGDTPKSPDNSSHSTKDSHKDFEILLKDGRVVDGTGAPWYVADVGIRAGKIAKIGRLEASQADRVIDASNRVVAPGFIDMMGQTASPMLTDPKSAINLLTQGITTINAGEGVSAAPLSAEEGERKGWTTMAEYFALLEIQGLPVNVVQSIGHTQVRRMVLGEADRRPSPTELIQMKELVSEAMEAGAIGVSTALIYPPAVYAQTEEISALVKVAGSYGGRYYTHMRNEGDNLLEAIDEALAIGRVGKTPVHIFHLKTAGEQNWGKMQLAIAKIRSARASGEQVSADVYPYVHNGLEIGSFIHPRHFAEGRELFLRRLQESTLRDEIRKEMETTDGWENWFRHVKHDWDRVIVGQTKAARYREHTGKSVAELAAIFGEDPWETFFELVFAGAFALPQSMSEANKNLAIQQEFISFCTDVGPADGSSSASHPRAFGSFPRLLSRYVRDWGTISLERAVAQASAVAANDVFAYDRGRIAEGLAADVIVFDDKKLTDRATFAEPNALSEGIEHVIVNGKLVLEAGKFTGERPGRVLRGPGYRPASAPPQITTGTRVKDFDGFEQRVGEFMTEHRVPGMAVAITEESRVIYSRGFGYSDLAKKEPVTTNSLFRIASISKPITAVAVMQLVEQGKLTLDTPIFSILDFEAEIMKAGSAFDPRLRQVTIEHLLQHRGGWDRDLSFDAMFQSVKFAEQQGVVPPAGPRDVIVAMLRQKLDFDPGARYAYSNFGYCLLGRVIEKLSDQPYERYVIERVLKPARIERMRIGASRLSGRAEGEVRYYHPGVTDSVFQADLGLPVAWPYGGWHLEAMDSHGGWIATAEDLAKFAMALDDYDQSPLLKRESIELMHARPDGLAGFDEEGKAKDVYYSLGWQNRILVGDRINHWHTGSLAGTVTILIRRHDGRNLVALLNSRTSPTANHLGQAVDRLLGTAIPVR